MYLHTTVPSTLRFQLRTDLILRCPSYFCCRSNCTVSTQNCTTTCRKRSTSRKASWVSLLWSRYCTAQNILTDSTVPDTSNMCDELKGRLNCLQTVLLFCSPSFYAFRLTHNLYKVLLYGCEYFPLLLTGCS